MAFRASSLFIAVVAGVAGAVLAPALREEQDGSARPLLKRAVKRGLALYDKGVETLTELGEHVSDLVAEARFELEEERLNEADIASHTDQIVPLRTHREDEAKAHG